MSVWVLVQQPVLGVLVESAASRRAAMRSSRKRDDNHRKSTDAGYIGVASCAWAGR